MRMRVRFIDNMPWTTRGRWHLIFKWERLFRCRSTRTAENEFFGITVRLNDEYAPLPHMVRRRTGNSICSIRAVLKVCLSTVSKRFEKVYWWNVLKFGYFSVPFKKWERTKFSLNCVLKSEIFYRQRFYVWPYADQCVEQKKYGFYLS